MVRFLTRGRGNGWIENGTINYQEFDRNVFRAENPGDRGVQFFKGWRAKKIQVAAPAQYDEVGSAKKLVKGIAMVHSVVIFAKGQHLDAPDENYQLLNDMFEALNVPFKSVDVNSDPTMHLGLPQYDGKPILPYIYVDGLRLGDVKTTLDMLTSGDLFKKFDQGNISYNKTVAEALRRT